MGRPNLGGANGTAGFFAGGFRPWSPTSFWRRGQVPAGRCLSTQLGHQVVVVGPKGLKKRSLDIHTYLPCIYSRWSIFPESNSKSREVFIKLLWCTTWMSRGVEVIGSIPETTGKPAKPLKISRLQVCNLGFILNNFPRMDVHVVGSDRIKGDRINGYRYNLPRPSITFIFLVYSKRWNKPFILTIDPNFLGHPRGYKVPRHPGAYLLWVKGV